MLKVGIKYIRWSLCTHDERMICFELCILFCDIQRGVVSNFVTGMFVVSKQLVIQGRVLFLCRKWDGEIR